MKWDEKAEESTLGRSYRTADEAWAHVIGARWQRAALLTPEVVERVALGIHASHDRGDWDEELPVVQDEYRDMARAALTAALGEDESNE